MADFLQRWLLHVPVPQTRTVRCSGLYHATRTAALALCRAALGQPPEVVPVGLDWQTVCAQRGEAHLSGVPPVASGSCVRASSRGEEHLPAWHQRSAPHEIRITGELPGAWCAWWQPGDEDNGL